MQRLQYLFLLLICFTGNYSKAIVYENRVFASYIKSVQLYPFGMEMAMPILNFNTNEKLILRFDDLSGKSRNYYYTVIQCHSNWTPTIMNEMEYIDGFTEANINDYEFSEGTKVPYTHYKLEFPNNDMKINRSGNYVLIVYENNKSQPVFTRRFMIAESKAIIEAGVVYPRNLYLRNQFQEIIFKVNYKGFNIENPRMDIRASVIQNQRWDNAMIDVQPMFVGLNELNFDLNGKLFFPSVGREFRFFDMGSLRFRGQNIRAFDIREDENDVYLLYDQAMQKDKYLMVKDLNGQFYINNLDNPYYNTGSDYANVHFNLDVNGIIPYGNFYAVGAFNDWICDESSKLQFDPLDRTYTLNMLLKQGTYNYTYLFIDETEKKADPFKVEGAYYDTENDYVILLYYAPLGERYDRLIAVRRLNSIVNRW